MEQNLAAEGGRSSSVLSNNTKHTSQRRDNLKDKKDRRTSKQELCSRLYSLEGNNSPSPDRVSRLYAMLQSTDKGVNRLRQNQRLYFNENIKMDKNMTKKLDEVNAEIRML